MNITINDKLQCVAEGATVGSVMESLNIQPKGIAVAMKGKLVPADKWNETQLTEGDSLVVIKAFYGG
ncbi:MAG: sulfur carrier protein ThiS [Muribaculaceae bacterium]|nr:sulfur carrier protein ThiS [Muribaculaceae bacterium]